MTADSAEPKFAVQVSIVLFEFALFAVVVVVQFKLPKTTGLQRQACLLFREQASNKLRARNKAQCQLSMAKPNTIAVVCFEITTILN